MLDATPLLRLYGRHRRRRLAAQDPAATQERQLLRLVKRARATRFGRDHGFAAIGSVADFQRAVPLRRYEDFWADYWEPTFPRLSNATWPGDVAYIALTSGTSSGRTKHIPVTAEMARSNARAGVDLLVFHLANRPKSRVLGGKNFMLGGSVDLTELGEGVLCGDLTGIARREAPRWSGPFVFPSIELARETDWEAKAQSTGLASLDEDIRTLAGTPSWMLLFLDRLAELTGRPKRLASLYPNLELLVHGGVNFKPYRPAFEGWLEGTHAELREVYSASEGFIAFADAGPDDGLAPRLDVGLFFEFVPVEDLESPSPRRHWIADAQVGRDYAIALSTCAGLWAYLLGDTVRLVSRDPPRLVVTGRTSYFLSAFGEHLTGEEIENAVVDAARALGAQVAEFSLGAHYPQAARARGHHLHIVEFRDPARVAARLAAFARDLDRRLKAANKDYETHRAADFGMGAPEVIAVRSGTFNDWMRARGRLGGQNKVPRVVNDSELFANLRAFAAARAVAATHE